MVSSEGLPSVLWDRLVGAPQLRGPVRRSHIKLSSPLRSLLLPCPTLTRKGSLPSVPWRISIYNARNAHVLEYQKYKWGIIQGRWLSKPLISAFQRHRGRVCWWIPMKRDILASIKRGWERKEGRKGWGEKKNTGDVCETLEKMSWIWRHWQKEKKLELIDRTQGLTESSRLKAMSFSWKRANKSCSKVKHSQ